MTTSDNTPWWQETPEQFAETRLCTRCRKLYSGPPAISRKDNQTAICRACGEADANADLAHWLAQQKGQLQEEEPT